MVTYKKNNNGYLTLLQQVMNLLIYGGRFEKVQYITLHVVP